ncbi:hypothetical protein [Flavobacterium sp. 9]|uniref:hypothetical protein n=1 Tax=Flavobacterium sp. 9 TaxID=2035198 RepID=UPI0011982762|nr:hypothetical protein [Flavobacterium sp. 9]
MKKVFKTGYAKEVLARLNQNGIVNQKGEPFGTSYITHVFNGRNSNLDIEETIISIYQEKLEEVKEISKKRKEIFSTKKPDAGNIGS